MKSDCLRVLRPLPLSSLLLAPRWFHNLTLDYSNSLLKRVLSVGAEKGRDPRRPGPVVSKESGLPKHSSPVVVSLQVFGECSLAVNALDPKALVTTLISTAFQDGYFLPLGCGSGTTLLTQFICRCYSEFHFAYLPPTRSKAMLRSWCLSF